MNDPGVPPPPLSPFPSLCNALCSVGREGGTPWEPRGRSLVALTGCRTRLGCRQDHGRMETGRARDGCRQHFHGNTTKKQQGHSSKRRKGSGETLLPWRAQGHKCSSTMDELRFPPQDVSPTSTSGCYGDPSCRSWCWGPSPFPSARELGVIVMQRAEAVACP